MNTKEIKEAIALFKNSKHLNESERAKEVLDYLFDCYQKNIEPTIASIAENVLNKNIDVEGTIAHNIRGNIYYLRKKLKRYYELEGANAAIQIQIPKGKYLLTFHENEKPSFNEKIKKSKLVFIPILTLLLGISLGLIVSTMNKTNESNDIPSYYKSNFWKDLIYGDKRLDVVFESFALLRSHVPKNDQPNFFYRKEISNGTALKKFLTASKDTTVRWVGKIPKSHTIVHNSIQLAGVLAEIKKHNKVFQFPSYGYKTSGFGDKDVLYFGHMSALHRLESLLLQSKIKISKENNDTFLTDKQSYTYHLENEQLNVGYFLATKISTKGGTNFFYFTGTEYSMENGLSIIQTDEFTQKFDKLALEQNKALENFEVLIEIKEDKKTKSLQTYKIVELFVY